MKEVVASFESVHLKDKGVDFENVYYRIVLADITLWCNPTFQGDKGLAFKWSLFLKSCSLQIFSGDERPFATKVPMANAFLLGSPCLLTIFLILIQMNMLNPVIVSNVTL